MMMIIDDDGLLIRSEKPCVKWQFRGKLYRRSGKSDESTRKKTQNHPWIHSTNFYFSVLRLTFHSFRKSIINPNDSKNLMPSVTRHVSHSWSAWIHVISLPCLPVILFCLTIFNWSRELTMAKQLNRLSNLLSIIHKNVHEVARTSAKLSAD